MPSSDGNNRKRLVKSISAFFILLLLLTVALRVYIATPYAASHLSAMLSNSLGQPVVIKSVTINGGVLHLKGLSLPDPDGSPSKMLSIDSIVVAPVWLKLLSDRRVFEKIAVEGITLDLHHNSAGIWNFSKLQKRFSSSKPSAGELLVRDLEISNGKVQINDHKLDGLSLKVLNLATKGSEKTGFRLEFQDSGRNRYMLWGKASFGRDPEMNATLTSASISLKSLAEIFRAKSSYTPEQGTANLDISLSLQKGMLKGEAEIGIAAVSLPASKNNRIFNGNISLAAAYDLQKDYLTLANLDLHLDKLLAIKASGSVRELKQSKQFKIDMGMDEIDAGAIANLIPELEKRKISINGKLKKSSIQISGNAAEGIVAATGNSGFANGSLMHDGKLVFDDLTVTMDVSGKNNVLTASGKAAQSPSQEKPLFEMLDAPFRVTLDSQSKAVRAESSRLTAKLKDMEFRGRISYSDGNVLIENAVIKTRDAAMELARLSSRIPGKQVSASTVRYPLNLDFSGLNIRRANALLKGVNGRFDGAYASDMKERWLEGTAELAAEKAGWQGKETVAPALKAEFSRAEGKAAFKTGLLGGSVEVSSVFNPFAPLEKVTFRTKAKGIGLAGIMKYAGVRGDNEFSGGTLDGSCDGSYSRSAGFSCDFQAGGRDIALSGKGGKKILSGAGVDFAGHLSGRKLVIDQAKMTVDKDVAIKAGGAIDNAFQPDRNGKVVFTVPRTSLAAIADSFINVLPRSLQEATIGGDVSAEGVVTLREGKTVADGAISLARVNIDAPTEKMKISDINGTFPLSFNLAGKTAAFKPEATHVFSRQNYNALLQQLRHTQEKGETVSIGSISFGGLGVDSLELRLKAAKGITEIVSLDSSLYGGAIFGSGFFTLQDGIFYRGDMLVNGISLLQLCRAFPAITGYISGKVDGIFSFQGKGGKLSDITGFSELWARTAKDEKMLVSREFLQRLSGKKLSGFFFSSDRSYDHAGIKAGLEKGYLTFNALDISNTNFLGIRDLSVTIAPGQNRIAIDHLLNSIKDAAVRGKNATGPEGTTPAPAPPATEFKWAE